MNLQAVLPVAASMHKPTPTTPPPPKCSNGTLFAEPFYCPYDTTCCCDHHNIFKKCVYTCCPGGAVCKPHADGAACVSATSEALA